MGLESKKITSHDESAAIERCIRSFIIKSIHAIVQARSGNAYNSGCVSDVGARNNLMVYLEDDPEISATIKQTLGFGFSIKTGDTFSLEILMNSSHNHQRSLVVLEVWQFRLNTEDSLLRCGIPCSKVIANHSGLQPSISSLPRSPETREKEPNENTVLAVEEIRRSRLFERLGTLLKTLIATTRLLPAYGYSRKQNNEGYQMCYTLRFGEYNIARLGSDRICRQVGHLLPGLAVSTSRKTTASSAPATDAQTTLLPIFLNLSVCYRPNIEAFEPEQIQDVENFFTTVNTHKFDGDVSTHALTKEIRNMKIWARPTFATNTDQLESDFDTDPIGGFIRGHIDKTLAEENESLELDSSDDADNPPVDEISSDSCSDSDSSTTNNTSVNINDYTNQTINANMEPNSERGHNAPLQLPFSNVGISGNRLTYLFTELRNKTDLDLFQVPISSPIGNTNTNHAGKKTISSAVFDADALANELERHEKILSEFDDFLVDFSNTFPVNTS